MTHQEAIIRNAVLVVQEFRKLDSEMQMQAALIFLLTARKEGGTLRDLERETGLTSASVSRNIAALSNTHRKGRPGHGLVVARMDAADRRNRRLFLTAKGRAVLDTILERFYRHGN